MKKTNSSNVKTTKNSKNKKPTRAPLTTNLAKEKKSSNWQASMLSRIRALIKNADPKAVEELKWRGVPVWSHDGIICTGETYKNVVKMTFMKGASLKDPAGLFNSSLVGNARRAIDIREGDKENEKALIALIRSAVDLNLMNTTKKTKK